METYEVKVHADGDKFWYQNGQFHRLDGPACEYADGTKFWYQNDQRHRLDGPACEYASGTREWYIKGEILSEAEFNRSTNPTDCTNKTIEIDGRKYKLQEVL